MQQEPNETLRQYIKRLSQVRNSIPDVTNSSVIQAFKAGLRNRRFKSDYVVASEVVQWSKAINRKKKIPQPGLDKPKKKHKKALKGKKNYKPDNKQVLAIPEKFTKGKKDYSGWNKAKAPTD